MCSDLTGWVPVDEDGLNQPPDGLLTATGCDTARCLTGSNDEATSVSREERFCSWSSSDGGRVG